MEIRHFRYFVAVADELNFGRAARQLHMSQPPLSKRIADLEEELGVRLFDRSSKQISLTPAGEGLLPQARAALQAFDQAARVARAFSPTNSRKLRVALTAERSRNVLLQIVNQMHKHSVEVDIVEATTGEQHRMLASADVDIGVLYLPFDERGLRSSPTLQQDLGVLMHAEHPLAKKKQVQLTDLQPYPLVLFPRPAAPGLYDDVLRQCRAGGYAPSRVLHGVRMTAALLIAESAVALTTDLILKRRALGGLRELTWKPIEGPPVQWWTSVVCRATDRDSLTRVAVSVILEALQAHEDWVLGPRPRIGVKRAKAA